MPRRMPSQDYLVLKPIVPGRIMLTANERVAEYKRMEDRRRLFSGLTGVGGDGHWPYLEDQTLKNQHFKLPYIREGTDLNLK